MNTLTATAPVEQHDGYTITPLAPITIGKTTFQAHEQHIENCGESIVWLIGPRGASYTLRAHRPAEGLFVAQSFTSGQPMRRQGNMVLIRWIGDLIEQA